MVILGNPMFLVIGEVMVVIGSNVMDTLDHNANIGFQSRSRYGLMIVVAYISVAVCSKMFTIRLLYDRMIHMIFCTMVVCYIVLSIGEAMLW